MDGKIFDIQRFSIYDGSGIRTNVFFKGCNLRCLWCHNPESQKTENQLMYHRSLCTSCNKCMEICSKSFTESCTACGKCAQVCPSGARKISGEKISAEEVFKIVLRDKMFYETSGGGVTFSGGEPLLQKDFAVEILKLCKENGINTAVETALCVPYEVIEEVLLFTDLFLCDIKCIDEEKHKKLTGVSNRLILENAEKLKEKGVDIVFRMPVIPTLNDDEVEKVKRFSGDIPLELLAYHETGCSKYEALNMHYEISHIKPPSREFMEELAQKNNAVYHFTGV